MFIEYRQEVVRKIALCIEPTSNFKMDKNNNILIPGDEKSCKALLIANHIVDNLHTIFDFSDSELSEIYKHMSNNQCRIKLNSVGQFLDLLKIIGASQMAVL